MTFDAEARDFLLSLEFENQTWADALKAKIAAMAAKAREAFAEPPRPRSPYDDFYGYADQLGNRNMAASQRDLQNLAAAQQNQYQYSPYAGLGANGLAPLLDVLFGGCQCRCRCRCGYC